MTKSTIRKTSSPENIQIGLFINKKAWALVHMTSAKDNICIDVALERLISKGWEKIKDEEGETIL